MVDGVALTAALAGSSALGAHDADMARVMVTLRPPPEQANLEEVRRLLGLAREEVDPAFGVVNISPAEHLYTILVGRDAAARIADAEPVEGVFSNPGIEPFGPPEEDQGGSCRGRRHPHLPALGPLAGG